MTNIFEVAHIVEKEFMDSFYLNSGTLQACLDKYRNNPSYTTTLSAKVIDELNELINHAGPYSGPVTLAGHPPINFKGLVADNRDITRMYDAIFRGVELYDGFVIRLTIQGLGREQDSIGDIGNRRFLNDSVALIQVYFRHPTDVKVAYLVAKAAADVFDGKRVPTTGPGPRPLVFYPTIISELGPESPSSLYQLVVEAPFTYEEVK